MWFIFWFNRPLQQRNCTSIHMEQFNLVAIRNPIHGCQFLSEPRLSTFSTPTAKSGVVTVLSPHETCMTSNSAA